MRKYREYTDDDIVRFAAEVESMAGLIKRLNLKAAGGNYVNLKRKLQELKVDCSHWKGMSWNRGQQLKDWSQYTKVVSVKKHLLNLRGCQCESCLQIEWLSQPIPLEIHHKDGDRTNNELENLALLCCNCHALTDNWRNKKR